MMKTESKSTHRSARFRLVLTIFVFLLLWTLLAFLLHPGPINLNPVNLIPGGPRSSPFLLGLMGVMEKYVALDTLARLSLLIIGFLLAWQASVHFLNDIYDFKSLETASHILGKQVYGLGYKSQGPQNIFASILRNVQEEANRSIEFSMDCTCRSKDGIRIRLSEIAVKANPVQGFAGQSLNTSEVRSVVKTNLNNYYRSHLILQLLIRENKPANSDGGHFPIEVFPEILALSPGINQYSSISNVKYKAIFIPEVNFQQNMYTFDLATPSMLFLNQEFEQSESEIGMLIQIIGIEKWEGLPSIAQKELEQIWEFISAPTVSDQPEKISYRKSQIEQNLYLEHLEQVKRILANPEDQNPFITILLFYYEFFQRKLEDFRFESEPIPSSLTLLVTSLEEKINNELIKGGYANESK